MKKIVVLAILAISFNFAFAQPKLEIIGGNSYDWGKVSYKKGTLNATIKIKNSGNAPLKIKEVKPGCGCTSAPIEKDSLQANEVTNLQVTLNISSYQGEITKSIRISSNDPNASDQYLYLKANVIRPLAILPSQYLGKTDLILKQENEFTYSLKNQTTDQIKIAEVDIEPKSMVLDLKVNDVILPNAENKYKVIVTPDTVGRFNGRITVKTTNPEYDPIYISIYGSVIDRVVDPAATKQNQTTSPNKK